TFRVSQPAGEVVIPADSTRPVLIVAAGTGISQAHSLLDGLPDDAPEAFLVWCVADAGAEAENLLDLSAAQFECKIIVDDTRNEKNLGISWLVDHFTDFAEHRLILCGSPGFVYAICDALAAAGLSPAGISSDVFSYAPRTLRPSSD
ncbi:MAG: hypothetical protein O3A63_19040, partial [Proteobacteria bacterium]|nr:hypothetical protein [Pseudomonadota bacterium]